MLPKELRTSLENKIAETEQANYPGVDIYNYLKENISFELNDKKKEAMTKFLELAKKLEPVGLL